jgi:hypothetical protein
MKNSLALGWVALILWAAVTSAVAQKKPAATSMFCGTAYSVGSEDGTLLLQHHGEFLLVDVGSDAKIRNGKGKLLALEDIRPGDWIEYWSDAGKIMTQVTAREISVNRAGAADCSAPPQVLGKNG